MNAKWRSLGYSWLDIVCLFSSKRWLILFKAFDAILIDTDWLLIPYSRLCATRVGFCKNKSQTRMGFFIWPWFSRTAMELDPNFNASQDVSFLLYTRRNHDEGQNLSLTYDVLYNLSSTNFNPDLSTKIMVRGWLNDYNSRIRTTLIESFLCNEDCNVVSENNFCYLSEKNCKLLFSKVFVNYGPGSKGLNYPLVRYRIQPVAVGTVSKITLIWLKHRAVKLHIQFISFKTLLKQSLHSSLLSPIDVLWSRLK